MTRMLLAATASVAALGAFGSAAQAQMMGGFHGNQSGSGFVRFETGHGDRFDGGGFGGCFPSGDVRLRERGEGRDGHGGHSGGHHGNRCGDTFLGYYGGEWALYNNRSFDSDSFNGWWHDRPDRAYPAWVQRNQNCLRPWFSGDTLTC